MRFVDESGVQRQVKIARMQDVTFADAQKAAKRLRSEIVLGGNPASEKERRKAVPTYASLADQHVAEAKTYQRSWWSVDGILRRHIVPRWGRLRLTDIKGQDVAKWLGELRQTGLKPATVDKIQSVFHRSFVLARRWNLPGSEINPIQGLPRPRYSNGRTRSLTPDEVQRLKEACEKSANLQLKNVVGLLLCCGMRKNELLHAKWEHVDFEHHLLFIPQTKNGKSRHIPLSQAARDIIRGLPRVKDSPYLVPNLETGLPFVSLKRAWQTARKEAGLEDVTLHDLRHAFASALANAGVSLYAIAKILGHSDHSTTVTARYSHLQSDTLLAAVEAGAAKLKTSWAQP
jgi:integrase